MPVVIDAYNYERVIFYTERIRRVTIFRAGFIKHESSTSVFARLAICATTGPRTCVRSGYLRTRRSRWVGGGTKRGVGTTAAGTFPSAYAAVTSSHKWANCPHGPRVSRIRAPRTERFRISVCTVNYRWRDISRSFLLAKTVRRRSYTLRRFRVTRRPVSFGKPIYADAPYVSAWRHSRCARGTRVHHRSSVWTISTENTRGDPCRLVPRAG